MRVALALLFLLGGWFLSVPAGAEDLPTADQLTASAKAAAGPVPVNYRETIVQDDSNGGTKIVEYHAGKNMRRTVDRDGFHSESGVLGDDHWRQNYNGLVRLVPVDAETGKPDPVTETVTHVTQPFDAFVVASLNLRAAGTRTYYDSKTFRRVLVEDVDATGTTVTTFDEYGTFGNRTLPVRWTVAGKNDPASATKYRRTEYVAGGTSNADLQPGAPQRQLVEFPSGVAAVDLPVRFIDHDVYVRVTIGGRAVDFELDTGASGIVISPDLASDLHLPLLNAYEQMSAKKYIGYNTRIPEMHVGSLRMRDIVVSVDPLPPSRQFGVKYYGLLGFDFLAQLGVTIDYEHETVRVVPADDYVPPADPSTGAFDIHVGDGRPLITVSVGDVIADRMMLDTGDGGELAFFDYFARRYPKTFNDALGEGTISGVGGDLKAQYFKLHDIALGSLHLKDFEAVRLPASSYLESNDGIIGNHLLALFVLGLDYTHGRVYLTPRNVTKRAIHN